jgi:hypothetical protein
MDKLDASAFVVGVLVVVLGVAGGIVLAGYVGQMMRPPGS